VFLLVTGASGAGKSTVRRLIAGDLSPEVECVELAGVVDIPRVMTKAWRQEATEAVVQRAVELQGDGRHLLLSGDPVAAAEVLAAPSADRLDAVAVCLLDLEPNVQAARLAERGDDPTLLVHHQAFAAWMRAQAHDPRHMLEVVTTDGWDAMRWERLDGLDPDAGDWNMHVVEASRLSTEQAAEAVLSWCRDALVSAGPQQSGAWPCSSLEHCSSTPLRGS
jgi:energy-coupling factor transporter ATP-binding protein EcfA2